MLTDTEIREAKPRDTPYNLTDGLGLFVLVTPAGGKLWRWKYRFKGAGKQMSYGRYPELSLAAARERHSAARKLLADGVDPSAARRMERQASGKFFRVIAGLWLEHWSSGKSPRHVATTARRLHSNVFPHLGARPVTEIEAPELVAMAKAIEARGTGELAKRALETTGQILRYAVAHGHAQRSPSADIRPRDVLKSTVKVNFARVSGNELPALLRAIEVYNGKPATRLAMKLMALTFVRTGELIGGRWAEIDWEARRWDIPAERMKMRSPHIVPLSKQGLEVLELLRSVTGGCELIFPGDLDQRRQMSNNTILFALRRLGYGGRMTGHGFRGLASTLLHEQGWPHEHIELQLAHAPRNAVSAAYNHALYLGPRAKMMQAWADFLEQSQRGGTVVPIRSEVA